MNRTSPMSNAGSIGAVIAAPTCTIPRPGTAHPLGNRLGGIQVARRCPEARTDLRRRPIGPLRLHQRGRRTHDRRGQRGPRSAGGLPVGNDHEDPVPRRGQVDPRTGVRVLPQLPRIGAVVRRRDRQHRGVETRRRHDVSSRVIPGGRHDQSAERRRRLDRVVLDLAEGRRVDPLLARPAEPRSHANCN